MRTKSHHPVVGFKIFNTWYGLGTGPSEWMPLEVALKWVLALLGISPLAVWMVERSKGPRGESAGCWDIPGLGPGLGVIGC